MDLVTEPAPNDDARRARADADDPDARNELDDRRHEAFMWSRDVVVEAWLERRL